MCLEWGLAWAAHPFRLGVGLGEAFTSPAALVQLTSHVTPSNRSEPCALALEQEKQACVRGCPAKSKPVQNLRPDARTHPPQATLAGAAARPAPAGGDQRATQLGTGSVRNQAESSRSEPWSETRTVLSCALTSDRAGAARGEARTTRCDRMLAPLTTAGPCPSATWTALRVPPSLAGPPARDACGASGQRS